MDLKNSDISFFIVSILTGFHIYSEIQVFFQERVEIIAPNVLLTKIKKLGILYYEAPYI